MHRSSQRDNRLSIYLVFISLAQNAGLFFCLQCVFDYLFVPAGPRSTAAAVSAENMPQAYFPIASTVLKEIIRLSCISNNPVFCRVVFYVKCVLYDYLFVPAGPRSTAAVVSAKNMPQAYFPNASTVLKEIIAYRYILYLSASHKMRGCFFVMRIRFLCYNCPVFCRAFLFKSG